MSLAGLSQGQLNIPCAIIKLYLWRDHREGGRPPIGRQSKLLQGGAMYLLLLWLSWVSHKCPKLFSSFCFSEKIASLVNYFVMAPSIHLEVLLWKKRGITLRFFFSWLSATRNAIRPLLGTLSAHSFPLPGKLSGRRKAPKMPSVLTTADLELGGQPLRTLALLFLSLGSNLQMPRITGPRAKNLSSQTWKITI